MYDNHPIIWASGIKKEIALSMTEANYIAFYQEETDVLPFMSLMKDISFVLEPEDDVPKVQSSLFEKPVIVHEDNQGKIALTFAPQTQPHTNHIVIMYHHFQSFVVNGTVKIQPVDMR